MLAQLEALRPESAPDDEEAALPEGLGLTVEFESFPDVELAFESLAREGSGIELLNVRHVGNRTYATVFVPDGKLAHFERLIHDYLERKHDKAERPRDNQRLIDAIREIRAASLRALWTDAPETFPTSDTEPFWWEVWLSARDDRDAVVATFRQQARSQELQPGVGDLRFPERTVILVRGTVEQMRASALVLNSIAELRRAKETADFFDGLPSQEQADWLQNLLARTEFTASADHVPHVCLLDTGVNRGHPLLTQALATGDLHAVEPGWGTDDSDGHGTQMAGLALFGNLTDPLASSAPMDVAHRLESVKLLPADGSNAGDGRHHGFLTVEAVARPEITAPTRRRVFEMAVTARDRRDRGRPSAWSAAVDRLAADADGDGANPRLLVLSAGNIDDSNAWVDYPNSNATDGIQDPAQAWNALTVGACTHLVDIAEPHSTALVPLAPAGGLSPFSTTSLTWERQWPLKPDVLFEGGNAAKDALGAVPTASLSLLTTHHRPSDTLFTTANGTSAATALGSRMAAQIMAAYPELWPETVRGVIVHSAAWTDNMRKQFLPSTGKPSKSDFLGLVRQCGFGVPDLERALWTVQNSLTLIVQEQLTPFQKEKGKKPALRELHLHRLPWPRDVLNGLQSTPVEMRVTLSYFVEPNPSARGVRSRYRYESHGLRFDVKRPLDSNDKFRKRINRAALEDGEDVPDGEEDAFWDIGKQNRHRGSVHSDIWRGEAVKLANRDLLAVYPSLGWWKTRHHLGRFGMTCRYALIVSISAPEVAVDLYTEVANQIAIQISAGA